MEGHALILNLMINKRHKNSFIRKS